MVFLGSWLSGYLIVATDAWMQHPVGYTLGPRGEILLADFWALLLNPWALWQYAHNMTGAVITACFVVAAVGAFYLLSDRKSTRLNSSHRCISYAVFCLKKKKKNKKNQYSI